MNLPTVLFPDHMTYDDRYEYYMVPVHTVRPAPPAAALAFFARPAPPTAGSPTSAADGGKRTKNGKYLLGSGPVGPMDIGGMAIMGMCSLM